MSPRDTVGLARSGRAQRPTAAMVLAATLFLLSHACAAQEARTHVCRVVSGVLNFACQAEVCTSGSATGDLAGRFTTRVTSIYPGGSGWLATSWTKFELERQQGGVDTVDYAMMPFDSKGGPDLSRSTEVLTLHEATGTWEGYAGTIVVDGGHAAGRPVAYIGRLCRPMLAEQPMAKP